MQQLMEALQQLGSAEIATLGIGPLLAVLLVSLGSSFFVSYLYQVFYRARATGSQVHRAFPLMGVSITAIFIAVQFSLPLSLGLLGALSIVRFRTPVKEPEEIGFILLVIATSLAAATFNMVFLSIVLVVATLATLILQAAAKIEHRRPAAGTLVLTLRGAESRAKLDELRIFLDDVIAVGRIDSLSDSDTETTLHYSFVKLGEDRIAELKDGLAGIASGIESHVYFHRPGGA